jgi:hypothetical protein
MASLDKTKNVDGTGTLRPDARKGRYIRQSFDDAVELSKEGAEALGQYDAAPQVLKDMINYLIPDNVESRKRAHGKDICSILSAGFSCFLIGHLFGVPALADIFSSTRPGHLVKAGEFTLYGEPGPWKSAINQLNYQDVVSSRVPLCPCPFVFLQKPIPDCCRERRLHPETRALEGAR